MSSRSKYLIYGIFIVLIGLNNGCTLISGNSDTTKIVKPKTRKSFYNPKKHKKAKRTKMVRMRR